MLLTVSQPPPKKERQQSVNSFRVGSVSYTASNSTPLFLNWVTNGQSFQYVFVLHLTNMHAMSHRSVIFLACSSRVNISEPASYITVMILWTVSQVKLPSFQIPPVMSDSKCSNTSLLEAMMSSKNFAVCFCDLTNLTFQIIVDVWWAPMNVGSELPFA